MAENYTALTQNTAGLLYRTCSHNTREGTHRRRAAELARTLHNIESSVISIWHTENSVCS
ncbi:hypothetical protein [Candidatus Ichthyocystis hellenicum]|uniref:hypothetical protein n=1 Tax=Candidatus Ichthyocystis hellenicum TaxID=1561003 RepID=UPI0011121F4F|nr:hypothetical protein [Candidatus Ichthyocystis hellenicum]